MEKAILVGVETQENYLKFFESMTELKNLTETAEGEVVFTLTQKMSAVNRQTIIGKGKLEELASLVDAYEADIVIFNQELTPRQSQLIGEAVKVPVIDRVQLILDIFAVRARSKEGKLQVELAQLNYLLPRLVGQGKHLSRLGGGIGTRGPGETKLETDRRHIRQKITNVKRELKEVSKHRERSREKRKNSHTFQLGLIGYTNAGKSTLLNLLTGARTYAENKLFATLDPLTKRWRLKQGMIVTVTDTVGFIQDLPTQLIEAFQSTLEESRQMDLLLHVVDASSPDRHLQEETVKNLLEEMGMGKIPVLTVYNKRDAIQEADFTPTMFPNCLISARNEVDKERLEAALSKELMKIMVPYELSLPASKGQLLHQLKVDTLLIKEQYDEEKEVYKLAGYKKASYEILT